MRKPFTRVSTDVDCLARFWLIALLFVVTSCAAAADPLTKTVIQHGYFADSGSTTPPADDAAWEKVDLPDLWSATRPNFWLNGWYRFDVNVATLPKEKGFGFGLYIETVRTQTVLYVNGRYVGASGIIDGPAPDRIGFSQLFVVPNADLHEGNNVFHLRVYRPGAGGGISEIAFADYSALYLEWLARLLYNYASYALVGVTISTFGVFILLLWFQQRRHAEYFYFGAGALVWGLHSLYRLLPGQRFPLHFTAIWHFSNLLSVALLTIFCLRFAQRRWLVFERIVWFCALALLPVFYASTLFGTAYLGFMPEVTELAHKVFNIFILVALFAVMLRVKEDGGIESWLLLLGALSFSGPRLMAWIGVSAQNTLDPLSLTPLSIFGFVFIAGWILVERFVRAASDYERLNTQLELRVKEKSEALQAQLNATESAREEAEKANLAKSRFLAAASHDLRQPLHALGLFASALKEKTHDPEGQNLVAHINQSISALGTLFNGVLDVSKLDAGAVSPNIRNVELQRILGRIGEELGPDAESRQLRLRLVRTHLVVRSDPVLLERILRNLVQNALRYTNHGGVVVGARRRGSRVQLEVWDSGIGIAVEDQRRIFEEFYQVGNTERDRTQGLGLGLAIVKRLSDLLCHPLIVRSAPGRGTLFRISMEVTDASADEDLPEANPSDRAGDGLLRGKCIVIVDDEPSVRNGMVALFESWQCEGIVAADQSEAVAALLSSQRAPALFLVDYRLRDRVVGIDVINALRARFGHGIPAIIISGESSPEELARIKASGLPMLHKPVPPAKLRSMIFHLLAKSSTLD